MHGTDWPEFPTLSSSSTVPTSISRRHLLVTRILAVTTFTAYVCSQIHVLSLRNPEIFKPYSPHDYFVFANFAASTILNIYWLRQLSFRWDYAGDIMPLAYGWNDDSSDRLKVEVAPFHPSIPKLHGLSSAQVSCLPFHILGSVFLTAWSFAWVQGYFLLSQILVTGNLAVHLYAVFFLLHVEQDQFITPVNYLTHLVMKTNVGLAVLYMWKNWGIIDQIVSPSTAEMINSGVIFLLMTVGSGPDPTVGFCLLYDLTALLFGQPKSGPWYHTFHWIMIVICICLMAELHLSDEQQFSWLKGFDRRMSRATDRKDEDIERQSTSLGVSTWNDSGVPPYFPYAM